MDLMKGGSAIPRESEQNINLSAYNRVERDISGNIIGLSGRMQVDPISGASVGKIAPDWSAKTGGLGNPYTPGLDAFKQAQVKSAQASKEYSTTPAAIQSATNRQTYLTSLNSKGGTTAYGEKYNPSVGYSSKQGQKISEAFKKTKPQQDQQIA
jgi:hypothetical protein